MQKSDEKTKNLDWMNVLHKIAFLDEKFIDIPDFPGYMVSNKYRVFNQGYYSLDSQGVVPELEVGPHKGMNRIRSPKGYSVYVNAKRLWQTLTNEHPNVILKDKLFKNESFSVLVYDGLVCPKYFVSNYGRIYNVDRCRFIEPTILHGDKAYVVLMIGTKRKHISVASLVYMMFSKNNYDPNRRIIHKNGLNDDNHISNLTQDLSEASDLVEEERSLIYLKNEHKWFNNYRDCADYTKNSISDIARAIANDGVIIVRNSYKGTIRRVSRSEVDKLHAL